jgi:prepilin-type N-terminal cleavage/methylation domain-containing protein
MNQHRRGRGGFSLVEVMIAATIVAFGFTAIYMVSSQCMAVTKSTRNLGLASQVLQERMESLRTTLYAIGTTSSTVITSASVQALVANPTYSGSSCFLLTGTETIYVSGSLGASGTMVLTRSVLSGSPTVVTSGAAVSPLKVEVQLDWSERSGGSLRNLSRSYVTVVTAPNP